MKKIKWTIMALAVVFSIGGAFATRPHVDCSGSTQYYFNGTIYQPAGQVGVDYFCTAGGPDQTCTYYLSSGRYLPCATGVFDNGEMRKKNTTVHSAVSR